MSNDSIIEEIEYVVGGAAVRGDERMRGRGEGEDA